MTVLNSRCIARLLTLALLQRKAQRTQRLSVFEGKDVYGVHQPVHWRAAITRNNHQP